MLWFPRNKHITVLNIEFSKCLEDKKMDPDTEIISPSTRVSNRSSAIVSEDKRISEITNEKANGYDASGNESSETNGINKLVSISKNLSEGNVIAENKAENNQQTADLLQQETVPAENFEHSESKPSQELNTSNEIQEEETENHNMAIHDDGSHKSKGCCGCFVEVCFCITWYWGIFTNSIISCFRRCGSSLTNSCRKCRNRGNEDSDENYFYSGVNDTFYEINRDADENIVEVNEAPNILTNDCSAPDGGYDNRGVDGGVYDNCGVEGGGNDNCGVDRGGNDNCSVDRGGNDNSDVDRGGNDNCGVDGGGDTGGDS